MPFSVNDIINRVKTKRDASGDVGYRRGCNLWISQVLDKIPEPDCPVKIFKTWKEEDKVIEGAINYWMKYKCAYCGCSDVDEIKTYEILCDINKCRHEQPPRLINKFKAYLCLCDKCIDAVEFDYKHPSISILQLRRKELHAKTNNFSR